MSGQTVTITRTVVTTANNTPGETVNSGDTLKVASSAGIFTTGTGSYGISMGSNATVKLDGDVVAANAYGIYGSGNDHISISKTGSVFGSGYGIYLNSGSNTVNNAGDINGATSIGVYLAGSATDTTTLINSGHIRTGGTYAVYMSGKSTLTNSGTIEGSDSGYGVYLISAPAKVTNSGNIIGGSGINSSYALNLTNTGTIKSTVAGGYAVIGSSESDKVTNEGTISASAGGYAVFLGDGKDTFNDLHGKAYGLIDGGTGNDTFTGGKGSETFNGGNDDDTFLFKTAPDKDHADHIQDFTHGDDHIGLSKTLFALGKHNDLKHAFHDITNHAEQSDDRIIYNHDNGHLAYDADGSGHAHHAILFAVLDNHEAINYHDFMMV